MIKFKKGDRTKIAMEDRIVYGVISKGGRNKISMIVDGAESIISSHVSLFSLSDKPLNIDEPSCMDKWSIKSYKEIEGHGDSPTFTARICLNNKPVIIAENSGWGGSNMYYSINLEDRDIEKRFLGDCKEWGKQMNSKYDFELRDSWIHWKQNLSMYSVTAKEYLDKELV